MCNAHAGEEAYQTPTDSSLFQKHRDTFKAEGRGDRDTVGRDDFQTGGRGIRGDNRGYEHLQVPGAAAEPVRQKLAVGQMEYSEGEADLGTAGEILEAEGSGSDSLGDVYLSGSTGGAPLQGIDMVPHVLYVENT